MAKKKKLRAHQLPINTRYQIARKKERNPDVTYGELSAMFTCTYHQARQAHLDYLHGKLDGRTKRGVKRGTTAAADSDATFQSQFDKAMQQISQETYTGAERLALLRTAAEVRKTVQQIDLVGHMKRRDAAVIERLIRRYEGEQASDERILEIYHEELSKCQASL